MVVVLSVVALLIPVVLNNAIGANIQTNVQESMVGKEDKTRMILILEGGNNDNPCSCLDNLWPILTILST